MIHESAIGTLWSMAKENSSSPASSEVRAFGQRLALLRRSYGQEIGKPRLTQKEFAAFLSLETERYRLYEKGLREPPLWVLIEIRRKLGMNLNNLIAGEIDRAA